MDRKYAKKRQSEISKGRRVVGGPAGLVASVMAMAAHDYFSADPEAHEDARFYFASVVFQDHKSLLGLPADWMPEGVTLTGVEPSERQEQQARACV